MCDKQVDSRDYPAVSVIILTHNGTQFIDNLMDSLEGQTYPCDQLEIIFVDNASTDDTCEKIKEKGGANVRLVRLDNNIGYAAGNNIALAYAQYEYVVFLNQDTICHQNWLVGLVGGLTARDDVGACTSNIIMCRRHHPLRPDLSTEISTLSHYNLTCLGYARYYPKRKKNTGTVKLLSGCSFIIKKQTLAIWGYLFDEALNMYVEDTDLSLRLQNSGLKVAVSRESLVYHLHGDREKLNPGILKRVKQAIQNRVVVFYMNMSTLEFILFFPFLFWGSPLKILELSLSPMKKAVYFLPFSLCSFFFILSALFGLFRFSDKKKKNVSTRPRGHRFLILKLLFMVTRG